jgi:sigma54-dependent transcription regulator
VPCSADKVVLSWHTPARFFSMKIGELPAETQIALLRVLQERRFERVGGSRDIPTDVRIIGSMNFAGGSLDGRRELAIEVRDDDVVDRLHKVARRDWEHSHPLDLSDAGLLADLEGRVEGSAEMLAIDLKRGDTSD